MIRTIAAAAALLLLAALPACSESASPNPTTTAPPAETSIANPTAAPTAAATGAPVVVGGDFDPARVMATIEHLATEIGPRVAGTAAETEAAEYIAAAFRSYGYDAAIEPFFFEGFIDRGSTLELPGGDTPTVQALSLSRDGAVEAPLVAAGIGRPDEFPAAARGAIVVLFRGQLEFSAKVANAERAGAVGVIVVNNEPGEFRGALASVSSIPAVAVSQGEGAALLELEGSVVRLSVDTFNGRIDSANVVVRTGDGPCRVLAGGHYDSVPGGPGAHDNASGTAVVMELARTLEPAGREGVCFAAFGAEELGLEGSKAFVAALSPAEQQAMQAMLNFDMAGIGTSWSLIGSEDLVSDALAFADQARIAAVAADSPAGRGSDHASFFTAGIPVLFFFAGLDPNYHTPQDTADLVSPTKLGEAGAMGRAALDRILGSRA